jgi:hypothetical protein
VHPSIWRYLRHATVAVPLFARRDRSHASPYPHLLATRQYVRQQDFLRNPSAPLRPGSPSAARTRLLIVSAFLGEQEPHGMLVAGVVRGLPRPEFEVCLC